MIALILFFLLGLSGQVIGSQEVKEIEVYLNSNCGLQYVPKELVDQWNNTIGIRCGYNEPFLPLERNLGYYISPLFGLSQDAIDALPAKEFIRELIAKEEKEIGVLPLGVRYLRHLPLTIFCNKQQDDELFHISSTNAVIKFVLKIPYLKQTMSDLVKDFEKKLKYHSDKSAVSWLAEEQLDSRSVEEWLLEAEILEAQSSGFPFQKRTLVHGSKSYLLVLAEQRKKEQEEKEEKQRQYEEMKKKQMEEHDRKVVELLARGIDVTVNEKGGRSNKLTGNSSAHNIETTTENQPQTTTEIQQENTTENQPQDSAKEICDLLQGIKKMESQAKPTITYVPTPEPDPFFTSRSILPMVGIGFVLWLIIYLKKR